MGHGGAGLRAVLQQPSLKAASRCCPTPMGAHSEAAVPQGQTWGHGESRGATKLRGKLKLLAHLSKGEGGLGSFRVFFNTQCIGKGLWVGASDTGPLPALVSPIADGLAVPVLDVRCVRYGKPRSRGEGFLQVTDSKGSPVLPRCKGET